MKYLIGIILFAMLSSVSAKDKPLMERTNYTFIRIICIEGYKYVVYDRAGGITQMFEKISKHNKLHPPQPIKCSNKDTK